MKTSSWVVLSAWFLGCAAPGAGDTGVGADDKKSLVYETKGTFACVDANGNVVSSTNASDVDAAAACTPVYVPVGGGSPVYVGPVGGGPNASAPFNGGAITGSQSCVSGLAYIVVGGLVDSLNVRVTNPDPFLWCDDINYIRGGGTWRGLLGYHSASMRQYAQAQGWSYLSVPAYPAGALIPLFAVPTVDLFASTAPQYHSAVAGLSSNPTGIPSAGSGSLANLFIDGSTAYAAMRGTLLSPYGGPVGGGP